MAKHLHTGKTGEELAKQHLVEKGYNILETNWRAGQLEIDLIAIDKDRLVIIEVKTRSSPFLENQLGVGKQKQQNLFRAAKYYLKASQSELELRFDIVAIVKNKNKQEITHIVEAFSPVWK